MKLDKFTYKTWSKPNLDVYYHLPDVIDEDTEVIVCENLEVLKSNYVGNTRETFVDATELPIIKCKTTSDCNCTDFVIIGNCPVCTV